MDSIITPKDFNVEEEFVIGDIKSLSNGGKMAFCGRNGKPIVSQTPEMWGPFGMNAYTNEDTGITKYSLDLSFRDVENRPSLQSLMDMQKAIDKKLVQAGYDNSQSWFKKKYSSIEVVEALYTSPLKYPKDKETGEIITKYAPTMKVNLPHRDGEFKLEAYDKDANSIDLNSVTTKGAKFTCIVQFGGVWFAGGKFGCTWRVVQIQVIPPSTIKGFSFKKVEGDKIENGEDDIDEVTDKVDNTVLNDSDDDM